MDPIVSGETGTQLTTQDLKALVNIEAELERLNSLEDTIVHSSDDSATILTPTDEEQQHGLVDVAAAQLEEQQQVILTDVAVSIPNSAMGVIDADGVSYEVTDPIGDEQAEETLAHFLDDGAIASTSEVTIGGSSDLDQNVSDHIESGDDHKLEPQTLEFGMPEEASAMSLGASYTSELESESLVIEDGTHDIPSTNETLAEAARILDSSGFTILSAPVMSAVAANPAAAIAGSASLALKTEPQVEYGTHELTAIAEETLGSPSSELGTLRPPAVKTVTVAPSSILDRSPTRMATAPPRLSKPIYLIPSSSGHGLTMTTIAPTVVTTKSSGEALINKVVFTATNPLAAAGIKVQAPSRNLSAMQSRVVPTVVKAGAGHSQLGTTASTTTTTGSNNQVITKVIFANSADSTQTITPGQTNAILAGLPQPVKIVTASQAQTLVGQNKSVSLCQAISTSPIRQQQQQHVLTSVPGSPSKQTFMLGKYALSSKVPTTIAVLPMAVAKSPAKIAPAGTSLTSTSPRFSSVISTMAQTPTGSTALVPSSSNPPKFIIRPVGSTLTTKSGSAMLSAISTGTSSSGSSPLSMGVGGTVKQITIPASIAMSMNSSSTTTRPVHGNKFSYIRLVQAPSQSTSVAGTTQTAATGSTIGVLKSQQIASAVSRSIASVTTTTSSAAAASRQQGLSSETAAPSQVKIAVPIAPSGHNLATSGQQQQQRILIPASAVGSLAQLRSASAVAGSSSTITLPANALAHLPLGATFFSPGGNIMMVPAQYVQQLQQQHQQQQQQQQPVQKQPLAVVVSAASAMSQTPTSTASQASTSVFSTSQPVTMASGGILKHPLAPSSTVVNATASSIPPPLPSSIASFLHDRGHSKHQVNGRASQDANGVRPRKPCNCTKSQCLKLYCDCFANGEFCHECNCNNCYNNLEHEEERQKAIKSCLERNPHAFHPKIDISFATKAKDGDIERRHNKGCNCKRSGCLKNYCECYEAKIMCSYMCKCVGCKNVEETADKKTLMHLADAAEVRVQQQTAARNKLSSQMMDAASAAAVTRPNLGPTSGDKIYASFITTDVLEATCQCVLAQAEEARRQNQSDVIIEQLVLQEFGRCLQKVIEYASKSKQ